MEELDQQTVTDQFYRAMRDRNMSSLADGNNIGELVSAANGRGHEHAPKPKGR